MSESTAAMRVTEDTAVDSVKQAQLAGDALTAIKTAIDTILASNKNIAATTLSHRDQMVSVKQRVEELNDLVGLVSEETGKVSQETQVVVRNISALYQQVNSFKGIE
jgi:methyl-accepting chemotaxis protein